MPWGVARLPLIVLSWSLARLGPFPIGGYVVEGPALYVEFWLHEVECELPWPAWLNTSPAFMGHAVGYDTLLFIVLCFFVATCCSDRGCAAL